MSKTKSNFECGLGIEDVRNHRPRWSEVECLEFLNQYDEYIVKGMENELGEIRSFLGNSEDTERGIEISKGEIRWPIIRDAIIRYEHNRDKNNPNLKECIKCYEYQPFSYFYDSRDQKTKTCSDCRKPKRRKSK